VDSAFEEPAFSPDLITGRKGLFIASLIFAQMEEFASDLRKKIGDGPAQRLASFILPLFKYIALRYTCRIRALPDLALCRTPFSFGKGLFLKSSH